MVTLEQPGASVEARDDTVLVTGATGYVGGRLIPRLLAAGFRVRCLVRDPARLAGRPWREQVEVVTGDVLQPGGWEAGLAGIGTAYYFVHSLAAGESFGERDATAARHFSQALRAAGGRHIVYLGGLGDPAAALSPHLRSRQETGDALREAGLPVTELRAAVIVGSGSLSFEMVRYLTERVPVMICPSWVYTRVQPIAIRNVLDYLVAVLGRPEAQGRILEIGGADRLTYGEMMTVYARVRGLRRLMVPVPVLTPRLSSYWVHLVTPVPGNVARPLIEGLRNEVVVRDEAALHLFPEIELLDYETSVAKALARLDAGNVETTWTDALVVTQGDVPPVLLETREGMVREHRRRIVHASPREVFRAFSSLGGERGWLVLNWMWQVRGGLDRLVGGVGMRRGRRHPRELRPGDALDFWRVEAVEEDSLIRLRAEMKVPGRAWLEFRATPLAESGTTLLAQTAYFAPHGLLGWLYWYSIYPLHAYLFSALVRRLAREAERGSAQAVKP